MIWRSALRVDRHLVSEAHNDWQGSAEPSLADRVKARDTDTRECFCVPADDAVDDDFAEKVGRTGVERAFVAEADGELATLDRLDVARPALLFKSVEASSYR